MGIPGDIIDLLNLVERTADEKLRRMGYKLLSSKLDRYGFRWEWFVQSR